MHPSHPNEQAPASIHGHEVMRMMLKSGRRYTAESLREAIDAQFGPAALFHTCSAEGLTAAELVAFLAQKGKFVESDDGFTTERARMCDHE